MAVTSSEWGTGDCKDSVGAQDFPAPCWSDASCCLAPRRKGWGVPLLEHPIVPSRAGSPGPQGALSDVTCAQHTLSPIGTLPKPAQS